MGFNNQAQRSTPPYYLDVDNPLEKSGQTGQTGHQDNQSNQGNQGNKYKGCESYVFYGGITVTVKPVPSLSFGFSKKCLNYYNLPIETIKNQVPI